MKRFALALLALLASGTAVHAADPVLLKLEYAWNGEPVSLAVSATPGAYPSSRPGEAPARWRVVPGNPIASPTRPDNRTVEFYRRNGLQDALVSRLDVRYFRDQQGYWVPRFQVHHIPLVYRTEDGWVPIPVAEGRADLVMLVGKHLPNAEGFYPSLEFTLGVKPVPIDRWVVKP
jgi:hypothetical protein